MPAAHASVLHYNTTVLHSTSTTAESWSVAFSCIGTKLTSGFLHFFTDTKLTADMCGAQDEHILARKCADRWMAKALGVGLFKRRLYRKEVEDTRQLLFTALNPLAKVSCCCCCFLTPCQTLLCCCSCVRNWRTAVLLYSRLAGRLAV